MKKPFSAVCAALRFACGMLSACLGLLSNTMAHETPDVSATDSKPVKIGVLAYRGDDLTLSRWQPTAEHLTQYIPGYQFEIQAFGLEPLRQAVERGELDFVITNTGQYVEFEIFHGVSRIATLKNNIAGKTVTEFGAVIFTRADRDDINSLSDLRGKHFMAVKENGFGGFQMAWREMQQIGINPVKDLASLRFAGFPLDRVAYAVLNGDVDAGTFRSQVLERMALEGKLNLNDIKIINPQTSDAYPALRSTRLYPEWPFSKLKHVPSELAEKVAGVLFNMHQDSRAAQTAEISGWTIPLDYQAVHQLMMELAVGPYRQLKRISLQAFIKQYWAWLASLSAVLVFSVVVSVFLVRVNARYRSVQRALQRHQHELVGIVHARTADLLVMRDQAMAASEAKSVFLSKMSHELRTPLNAIIGYCELLEDEVCEVNVDDHQCRDLNSIKNSAVHLLSIINDILDFSMIEHGSIALNHEAFSMAKLLGSVMPLIQPALSEHNNSFKLINNLPCDRFESDPLRMQDALVHILNNACKFTQHGSVTLEIELQDEQRETWLVFRVIDTGIGMTPAQQEKAFTVFKQGDDSTTRKFDGLGLGLAISRGYCRLMGGDITFSSAPGKGSEFVMRVPVKIVENTLIQQHANIA